MNRRRLLLYGAGMAAGMENAFSQQATAPAASEPKGTTPDKLLLKDYRPKSIYKIPRTEVSKPKFPVIDVHTHQTGARTPDRIRAWVEAMDRANIEKSILLSGATGAEFGAVYELYSKYPNRFQVWCTFDVNGFEEPGYAAKAVRELERCHRVGARGVGELMDKGRGLGAGVGTEPAAWGKFLTKGPHADDARLDPLYDKCAELGMPLNIHVAEPIWMYLPMDATNDGLMNAADWRLDNKPGLMGYADLLASLEGAVKKHPKTIFIAAHFANLDYDLGRPGELMDRYPNLYADICRYAEISPTPRFAAQFFEKHADRLLYGTDSSGNLQTYRVTFRILESLDEHFYEERFRYHWALNGLGLPDPVLRKVYNENARLCCGCEARKPQKDDEDCRRSVASVSGRRRPARCRPYLRGPLVRYRRLYRACCRRCRPAHRAGSDGTRR